MILNQVEWTLTVALILNGSMQIQIAPFIFKTASCSLLKDIHEAFPHSTEQKKHFPLA